MFLAFVALVMLASVPLLRGRLAALTELRMRFAWLLFAALFLQIAITRFPHLGPRLVLSGAHLASYALAAGFIWLNRRVPGLWALTLGAACNLIAIAANGGTLPASRRALIAAGEPPGSGFANSGVLAHPHLAWLGDIAATPSWLPFRNVISIGDGLILVGAALLIYRTCGIPRMRHLVLRRASLATAPVSAPAQGGPEAGELLGDHRVEDPAVVADGRARERHTQTRVGVDAGVEVRQDALQGRDGPAPAALRRDVDPDGAFAGHRGVADHPVEQVFQTAGRVPVYSGVQNTTTSALLICALRSRTSAGRPSPARSGSKAGSDARPR